VQYRRAFGFAEIIKTEKVQQPLSALPGTRVCSKKEETVVTKSEDGWLYVELVLLR
jgi:hypothetical protein